MPRSFSVRLLPGEEMEVAAVIYSYYRDPGYIYLHLPMRLTKECGIISGSRFNIFINDEKLIIEQIKEEPCLAGK